MADPSTPATESKRRGRIPPISAQARIARGRVGSLSRSRPPDDPDLRAARRVVAVEALQDHIRIAIPDLFPEDRIRLAALLANGDGTAAAGS
jgi:hypothetical protein